MYYLGFHYTEAYHIPIWMRRWFIERIQKEIKQSAERNGGESDPTRAAHQNTADARAMMGRHRSMVPAHLRRFT